MRKRMTDIDIWDKNWFTDLSCKHKCLIKYIFDRCDAAGIWEANFKIASIYIGEKITQSDLDILSTHLIQFSPGKYFVKDFISFQYVKLSNDCAPHKPVLALLRKYNLLDENTLSVRVSNRVSDTLQEKEKEQDKDQDKEKDQEQDKEKENMLPVLIKSNSPIQEIWEHYIIRTGRQKLPLTPLRKRKIQDRLLEPILGRPTWLPLEKKYELMLVIDLRAYDPFFQGQNDRGKKYLDLESHMLKSQEQVEKILMGASSEDLSKIKKIWEDERILNHELQETSI